MTKAQKVAAITQAFCFAYLTAVWFLVRWLSPNLDFAFAAILGSAIAFLLREVEEWLKASRRP